jgi:hypothetical protein
MVPENTVRIDWAPSTSNSAATGPFPSWDHHGGASYPSYPPSGGQTDRYEGGPKPPVGDDAHRYLFRLYAVREPLTLPDQPSADDVHHAVKGREQASGALVGVYRR